MIEPDSPDSPDSTGVELGIVLLALVSTGSLALIGLWGGNWIVYALATTALLGQLVALKRVDRQVRRLISTINA